MDNDKYYQTFISLGISVEPLPENYTSEEFGRRLMSSLQTESGVSYSASTEYDIKSEKYSVTSQ